MKIFVLVLTMSVAALTAYGFSGSTARIQWGDAAVGATLYTDRCASCHGADGLGGSAPSLLDLTCAVCGEPENLPTTIQNHTGITVTEPESLNLASYVYEVINGYPSPVSTVLVAHITAEDVSWTDTLQVNNFGISQAEYTIVFYNQGSKISEVTYTLPVNGYASHDLKALAPTATTAQVQYGGGEANFRLSYQDGTGGVAEFALSGSTAQKIAFLFNNVSSIVAWKGLALMNNAAAAADITLYAYGAAGYLGETTINLGPQSRVRGEHTAWFPGVATADIQSIVAVTASGALTGVTISGDNSAGNDKLLFTNAQPVPDFQTP